MALAQQRLGIEAPRLNSTRFVAQSRRNTAGGARSQATRQRHGFYVQT